MPLEITLKILVETKKTLMKSVYEMTCFTKVSCNEQIYCKEIGSLYPTFDILQLCWNQ